jgi:hypothetical protein
MSSLLRRMRKLSKLVCAAALFGIVQGPLHAEHDACKFSEWGYSYYRVEQQGEAWTYLLTASGPNWLNKLYGYHAPGFLVCDKCASAGNAWGGVYDFSARADLRPPTAAERAQRRKEWIGGYPNTQLGPEHIEHFASREGITLGPTRSFTVFWQKQAGTPSPKSLPLATLDFWWFISAMGAYRSRQPSFFNQMTAAMLGPLLSLFWRKSPSKNRVVRAWGLVLLQVAAIAPSLGHHAKSISAPLRRLLS